MIRADFRVAVLACFKRSAHAARAATGNQRADTSATGELTSTLEDTIARLLLKRVGSTTEGGTRLRTRLRFRTRFRSRRTIGTLR
jgi:hypothetical protein